MTLRWHYDVLHLWKMSPQTLQDLGQPALLALAGQTRLADPETELVAALQQIRQIEDEQLRQRITAAFVSLLPSNEVMTMMEQYLDADEVWFLELPYQKRLLERGIVEGRAEGRAEGFTIGQEQGRIKTLHQAITGAVAKRFDPPLSHYQQLEHDVATIKDADVLNDIFLEVVTMQEMESILQLVAQHANGKTETEI